MALVPYGGENRRGLGRYLGALRGAYNLYNNLRDSPGSLRSWNRQIVERMAQSRPAKRRRASTSAQAPKRRVVGAAPYRKRTRVSTMKKKYKKRSLFGKAKNSRVRIFKKRATVKAPKYGSVFNVETSGTLTVTVDRRYPCVVGHVTSGAHRMFVNGIRAVVKLVARKLKMDFRSWDQEVLVDRAPGVSPTSNARLYWNYQDTVAGDLVEDNVDVAATDSWDALAVRMANKIKDKFNDNSAGAELAIYQMNQIWWQWQAASAATQSVKDQPEFVISAKDIMLTFDCQSELAIQNRTPAVTVGTGDETNRNDIAANPLVGKAYNMTKGYVSLKFVPKDASGGNGSKLIPNPQSGVLFANPGGFNAEIARQYAAMPYAQAFENVKSCSPVVMTPGNVKKSYVKYRKTMRLNYFLKAIRGAVRLVPDVNNIVADSTLVEYPFAVGRFFLLRKSLHDGTDSDPFPTIAFQCQNKTSVQATHRNKTYTCVFKEYV